MIRSISLTILLFSAPFSLLWAQDDKQDMTAPKVLKSVLDYGLIHKEPVQKALPDSMPIYNPQEYDAKIQIWSPPFEWFNSMPVIGGPEEADSLNYRWIPNSTQQKRDQHK